MLIYFNALPDRKKLSPFISQTPLRKLMASDVNAHVISSTAKLEIVPNFLSL